MANTWTDYGISQMLDITFRSATAPSACSVRLLSTVANATVDSENWSAISADEVSNANGYSTGGKIVELSNVGFDVLGEAGNNQYLQIKDLAWSATGNLAAAGAALVLTQGGVDKVWAVFDFGGTVTATSGGSLTLQDCEIRVGV